jgi:hypothetical protein
MKMMDTPKQWMLARIQAQVPGSRRRVSPGAAKQQNEEQCLEATQVYRWQEKANSAILNLVSF